MTSGFKLLGTSREQKLLKYNFPSKINKNLVCSKLTVITHATSKGMRPTFAGEPETKGPGLRRGRWKPQHSGLDLDTGPVSEQHPWLGGRG